MDLSALHHRHRLSLMLQEKAGNEEERQAYRQFDRDYFARDEAPPPRLGRPSK